MPSIPSELCGQINLRDTHLASLASHSAQKSSRPRQHSSTQAHEAASCTETRATPTLLASAQPKSSTHSVQHKTDIPPPFFKNKSVICLMYKCTFPMETFLFSFHLMDHHIDLIHSFLTQLPKGSQKGDT